MAVTASSSTTSSIESSENGEQTDVSGTAPYADTKPPYFLYMFTSLAALGGFLFGYDTGIISGAIILLREVSVVKYSLLNLQLD